MHFFQKKKSNKICVPTLPKISDTLLFLMANVLTVQDHFAIKNEGTEISPYFCIYMIFSGIKKIHFFSFWQ